MTNPRTYGIPPYTVALVHGGPGALGEMAPLARLLAGRCGVLEPLQTAATLDGQVEELQDLLGEHGPLVLVGYSWGAWLSYLTAAAYPGLVKKLVLVSSGPFEAKYLDQLRQNRLARLSPEEGAEFERLVALVENGQVENGQVEDVDWAVMRIGELGNKASMVDPLEERTVPGDAVPLQGADFGPLMAQAQRLRQSGELLGRGKDIRCPVLAIHGDCDPHPAVGVFEPLAGVLADFGTVLLEDCGHTPWLERRARGAFLQALEDALAYGLGDLRHGQSSAD